MPVPIIPGCISFYSYIKPQLVWRVPFHPGSCISFYSYIKPQHKHRHSQAIRVVYRSIPTSNRNVHCLYHRPCTVVYRSIPTSNRNAARPPAPLHLLYIVLFLHQTATVDIREYGVFGCISFYSYIKPQHLSFAFCSASVVYRSIPTSNRN